VFGNKQPGEVDLNIESPQTLPFTFITFQDSTTAISLGTIRTKIRVRIH
jgi:hypothetical protein